MLSRGDYEGPGKQHYLGPLMPVVSVVAVVVVAAAAVAAVVVAVVVAAAAVAELGNCFLIFDPQLQIQF